MISPGGPVPLEDLRAVVEKAVAEDEWFSDVLSWWAAVEYRYRQVMDRLLSTPHFSGTSERKLLAMASNLDLWEGPERLFAVAAHNALEALLPGYSRVEGTSLIIKEDGAEEKVSIRRDGNWIAFGVSAGEQSRAAQIEELADFIAGRVRSARGALSDARLAATV